MPDPLLLPMSCKNMVLVLRPSTLFSKQMSSCWSVKSAHVELWSSVHMKKRFPWNIELEVIISHPRLRLPKSGRTFPQRSAKLLSVRHHQPTIKKHTYTGLSYQKSTKFEPNPKSKILENTKFQKFQIQNPKSKILNPKSQIQNPNAQNSNSQIQNPKVSKIQRCS